MSNVFGTLFRITIFGESHSAGIGVVIDGIPAGMEIDLERVRQAMKRRAPNRSAASTTRNEPDAFEVLSGCVENRATGAPLAAIIRNADTRSSDYLKTAALLRPGHADYTGFVKYRGANDIRGGGHFSGRLTAPVVFAGSIARQFLERRGITVLAHIQKIGTVCDAALEEAGITAGLLEQLEAKDFPVIDDKIAAAMQQEIETARRGCDSVGGVVECAAVGVPAGMGEPFFDSMESEIAHMMFAIPAVKGVEFGDGFALAEMNGSAANDCPQPTGGEVTFSSNHNGGINGGISNGMPVVFRVAVKPTPSIAKRQTTVDIKSMKRETIEIAGRHDACIVPRAVEAVKDACAIVLMDLFLRNEAQRSSI